MRYLFDFSVTQITAHVYADVLCTEQCSVHLYLSMLLPTDYICIPCLFRCKCAQLCIFAKFHVSGHPDAFGNCGCTNSSCYAIVMPNSTLSPEACIMHSVP